MDDKMVDEKIKKALIDGTDSALGLKEDVWNNIQNNLDKHNMKGEIALAKKKRKSLFVTIASTAAVIAIVFAVSTEPGRAAAQKIKDLFLPEKDIVQELEGQEEDTHVNLNESEMGYIIYVDESRYKMEKLDGRDRIAFKEELDDNIPDVYMDIEQVRDSTPEELATQIEEELKADFEVVRNEGMVDEPLRAIRLYARDGDEWNSKVVKYYLVNNGKGGTFVIKEHFFYEASEGHGVRFDNMLKDFKIIELAK